jgi:basic amino acid/polyamine antiporter, APA family
MIVVSAMIGSGVFKKIAPMAAELGNSHWIMICWLLAGLVTLLGALSNAEVAGMIDEAGGQYVYFRKMYGKLFSFLYGWASFAVIQTATTASVAFVFAESLNEVYALPALFSDFNEISIFGIAPFENFSVKIIASLMIILITIINVLGVQYGGFISNLLASTILVSMAVIVFCGFFLEPVAPVVKTVSEANTGFSFSVGISAVFTAMLAAFWAYEGWNTVGYLAGEIKNPKKYVPIALGGGVLIVIVNYLLVNGSFLNVLSIETFTQHHEANQRGENIVPAIEVMRHVIGKGGAILISILILLSTFNTSNNSIMSSPRIYYAMARDRVWWKAFAGIHAKYKTPWFALLMHGVLSIVFVVSGSFDTLTDMLVFAAFIFYGMGALGVFVLRKKMPDEPRPFKIPLIVPGVFVLFSIILVVNSLITQTLSSLTGIALVLCGLPVYFYFQHHNRKRKLNRRRK